MNNSKLISAAIVVLLIVNIAVSVFVMNSMTALTSSIEKVSEGQEAIVGGQTSIMNTLTEIAELLGEEPPTPVTPISERLLPPIVLWTNSEGDDPKRYQAGLIIAEAWRELGMNVDMRFWPDFAVYVSDVIDANKERPYTTHAAIASYTARPERIEPDRLLSYYQTGGGSAKYTQYSSSKYDTAFEAQRTELDKETRRQLVFDCQEILAEELPVIVMFYREGYYAYNNEEIKDVVNSVHGGITNFWTFLQAKPASPEFDTIKFAEPQSFGTYNVMGAHQTVPSLFATVYGAGVFDTLTKISAEGEPVLWAAESIDVVDDLTLDVKLRSGMKFHDGAPLTAEDVAFAFTYMKEWETGYFLEAIDPIATVTATDELTVRFETTKPYAPIYMTSFASIPILPKHIWDGMVEREGFTHPDEWTSMDCLIGSGPWKVDYWRTDEEVRLMRNDEHFNPPNFRYWTWTFFIDKEPLFTAFKAGTLNICEREGLTIFNVQELEGVDYITVVDTPDITAFFMNLFVGWLPFSDFDFRQAIAHTIDYERMVEVILLGRGERGAGVLAPANAFWHNPEVVDLYPDFDVEEARRILIEAGYEWDKEGRLAYPSTYTGDPYTPLP